MFTMKCLQAATMSLAAIGLGFTGTDASAGGCGSQRTYSDHGHGGGYVSARYRGNGYSVSVRVGSHRHYDSRHVSHRPVYHEPVYGRDHGPSYCATPQVQTRVVHHVQHRPSGCWQRVYHAPVYQTRYRPCGTPYRVCVRAGYYERVWVTTGPRAY